MMKKKGKYYPRTERDYRPPYYGESDVTPEVDSLRAQAIRDFLRAGGKITEIYLVTDQWKEDDLEK